MKQQEAYSLLRDLNVLYNQCNLNEELIKFVRTLMKELKTKYDESVANDDKAIELYKQVAYKENGKLKLFNKEKDRHLLVPEEGFMFLEMKNGLLIKVKREDYDRLHEEELKLTEITITTSLEEQKAIQYGLSPKLIDVLCYNKILK